MPVTKVLLFDTDCRGHHADYITCLIEYHQKKPDFELIIVSDERLIQAFKIQFTRAINLVFEGISTRDISQLHQQKIFRRSYNEWQLFCKMATKHQATQGLLMYFDVFQVGLLLGSKPRCSISGIYFRPDFHYKMSGWKAKLNAFRKKAMLRLILNKPFLNTLFSLDKTAISVIEPLSKQAKVLPISDPVKIYGESEYETEKLRESLDLVKERKTFLLFGFLDERKGIEKVLSALLLLDKSTLGKIQLLIVGVINSGYQQLVENQVGKLPKEAIVKTVFEEVKGVHIQRYFELTDYVLALYQHHVGMSQIVVRAAISQKPLISSDFGLMGEIVSKKNLGITTDSTNSEQIATMLKRAVNEEIEADKKSMKHFAEENSDTAFAETIFKELLH